MSTGIVIVTHGDSGAALRAEAEFIVGSSLEAIQCVSFDGSEGGQQNVLEIQAAISEADTGEGVLILSDLIGASPSNRATTLLGEHHALMLTGVNLAMVLCAWANREMTLEQLAGKVIECGRRSMKVIRK